MNILDITINDKKYTYVDSIALNDKFFVAYTDGVVTNISEYQIINNNLELFDIDDETFEKVKEALNL